MYSLLSQWNSTWKIRRLYIICHVGSLLNSLYSYPTNNCYVTYGIGSFTDPQEIFHTFLNHNAGLDLVKNYLSSSSLAQGVGKPFIMFETNSATCGGLPGVSDSFGAALWALDYGLTMAASNFSHALLHIGGQNVYYNVRSSLE